MTHARVCHDSYTIVPWLIHTGNMAPSYVWHDSIKCVTWLIHMCDTTLSYVRHDSFMSTLITYATRHCNTLQHAATRCNTLQHAVSPGRDLGSTLITFRSRLFLKRRPASLSAITWDMTHSYVWHDSFICVTWLIHMCDVTHLYVWHDSFVCVTLLNHMGLFLNEKEPRLIVSKHRSHDLFIRVMWLNLTRDMNYFPVTLVFEKKPCPIVGNLLWRDSFICVIWLTLSHDMPHSYVRHDRVGCEEARPIVGNHLWHDTFICVTWPIHMCGMTNSYVWHE